MPTSEKIDILERVDLLEDKQKDLVSKFSDIIDPKLKSLEASVQILGRDVIELKAKFPFLATKSDISELAEKVSCKIDASVTGLLKDTLNAKPAWEAALWTAIAAICAVGSAVLGTIIYVKGTL